MSPGFGSVVPLEFVAVVDGRTGGVPVSGLAPRATEADAPAGPAGPVVVGGGTSSIGLGAGFAVPSGFSLAAVGCDSAPVARGPDALGGGRPGGPDSLLDSSSSARSPEMSGNLTGPRNGSRTTSAESFTGCEPSFV